MTRNRFDPTAEARLLSAMSAILPAPILGGCRWVRADDEKHLLPEEARSIRSKLPQNRRESGAGRAIAHNLLGRLGIGDPVLPRAASGAPVWPSGVRGSIAHDEEVAVAIVTKARNYASLGIDVEPAVSLPDEVAGLVLTEEDDVRDIDRAIAARLVFSLKEAVYKAVFPLDGQVRGYEHIAVDLVSRRAVVEGKLLVKVNYCLAPRIVTVAFVSPENTP